MSKELNGYCGMAKERNYGDYRCLTVYPEYGNFELNVYRDEGGSRVYVEASLDSLSGIKVDILDEDGKDEYVKITATDRDGNTAEFSFNCSVNALLNAIEAERMALQAPTRYGNLS